jgi:hypothetical protein
MRPERLATIWAAIIVALLVGPNTASAAGWHLDPEPAGLPLKFVVSGNRVLWKGGSGPIECTSVVGSGQYETETTGRIQLAFKGCVILGGLSCSTLGQPSGTITTTEMTFHNVYVEPNKMTPAILVTPNEGHFASYACGGAVVLSGSGLIGDLASPPCGQAGKTATALFEASAPGTQRFMQVETAGSAFDLQGTLGSPSTASLDADLTITYERSARVTCV